MSDNKEQKTVVRVYGALCAAILFSVIPTISFAVLALVFFIGILIAAYVIRHKKEEDSLIRNHMSFIIVTLWVGIFILPALTLVAASIYLLPRYNPDPLNPCVQQISDSVLSNPEAANIVALNEMLMPCMDAFMAANYQLFLISALIAGGPIILYMGYRVFQGLSRALKGYRIAKPKSWF